MARDDPFAGIRLSEQTTPATPGKLDQRLFAPEPPAPSAKPAPPSKAEPAKTPGEPTPPGAQLGHPAAAKATATPGPRFDLKEEPLYKASFLFTQEELEGLEDLKLELRRQHDTKVTKNALIRLALHMLLEDHAQNGQRSYASRKIRKG